MTSANHCHGSLRRVTIGVGDNPTRRALGDDVQVFEDKALDSTIIFLAGFTKDVLSTKISNTVMQRINHGMRKVKQIPVLYC